MVVCLACLVVQDYSDVYREAGAAAIAVNVDATTGGCSYDDIKAVADEQRMAVNSRPEVLGEWRGGRRAEGGTRGQGPTD